MPIERLVVESVCSGSVLEASGPDLRSSRWRSMLVIPIVLDHGHALEDGRLVGAIPVGAIVLASDQDGARGLSRLRSTATDRAHLLSALETIGRRLLAPGDWRS
jgi:hypothetical protein